MAKIRKITILEPGTCFLAAWEFGGGRQGPESPCFSRPTRGQPRRAERGCWVGFFSCLFHKYEKFVPCPEHLPHLAFYIDRKRCNLETIPSHLTRTNSRPVSPGLCETRVSDFTTLKTVFVVPLKQGGRPTSGPFAKRCSLRRLNVIQTKRALLRPPSGLNRYPRLVFVPLAGITAVGKSPE